MISRMVMHQIIIIWENLSIKGPHPGMSQVWTICMFYRNIKIAYVSLARWPRKSWRVDLDDYQSGWFEEKRSIEELRDAFAFGQKIKSLLHYIIIGDHGCWISLFYKRCILLGCIKKNFSEIIMPLIEFNEQLFLGITIRKQWRGYVDSEVEVHCYRYQEIG